MTADFKFEQSSAGLDRLSEPNLPRSTGSTMPIATNSACRSSSACDGTARNSILRQFERRLRHDEATELDSALDRDFPHRRVAARSARCGGRTGLKVHGRLSTHVLDTHRRPPGGRRRDRTCRDRHRRAMPRLDIARQSPMPTAAPTDR